MSELRQNQQALRDRLKKLLEELKNRGLGQNGRGQQGQQGQQGEKGEGDGGMDQLGQAGDAMGDAEGQLGDGNADSAVNSQGRALDALRKGAQGLAQSMQQQMGQQGPGQNGRLGQPRAQRDTDPLGRPMRGRDTATTSASRCRARSTCNARAASSKSCAAASATSCARSTSSITSSGC